MFITFLVLINIYLFIRGWQALTEIPVLRLFYSGIFLTILILVILGFYFRNSLPLRFGYTCNIIGRFWIFYSIFFLVVALFADFLRVLNYFFTIFPQWISNNYTQVKIGYFIFVLLISIIVAVTGFRNFSNPRITFLSLSLDNKNKSGTFNIIAASDLHLGIIIQKERLADWIDMINKQDPDIIVLAGDIFDRTLKPKDSQDLIKELQRLRSKYGTYAVLGNSDYSAKVDRSVDYLARSGIKLLRDHHVTIDNRFTLIGRDDFRNKERKTLDSLVTGVDSSLPIILLNHRPEDLNGAVRNNIDLYISGHLHNGQIFPVNYFVSKTWELVYGYRKIGDCHFYVSSGLGVSYIPFRLGTRSEIVKILLEGSN